MLIEFSVANFRSFASEQRLSLNAGRFRSDRIGAVLDTQSKSAPHLLRSLAIMGANATGKSNLIEALAFFQDFVANSAQGMQLGEKIEVVPFRLDTEFADQPSQFEIVFLCQSREYHYSFSATQLHVVAEQLHVRESGKGLKELFCRERKGEGYKWNVPTIAKELADLWSRSTRENGLFLSQAVQLNSDEFAEPFQWLTKNLRIIRNGEFVSPSVTSHFIKDHVDDGCKKEILNLLREADFGICDIKIQERDFHESLLPSEMSDELKKSISSEMKGHKFVKAQFEHLSRQNESVLFEYEDESDGTQQLYNMAGPLITALRHDFTLVIDEIESSLHPYLLSLLVRSFQYPENRETKAQLIFTTHADGLLDSGLLERDQFWLVEKRGGGSELFPLNDYKPRKGEALRTNYLKGRYGGVPAIPQSVR